MMDYDYWKYTFGDRSFYIPRQTYLIKLGDYDQWTSTLLRNNAQEMASRGLSNPIGTLSSYLGGSCSIEQLAVKFGKPSDPNAKILDMSPQPIS